MAEENKVGLIFLVVVVRVVLVRVVPVMFRISPGICAGAVGDLYRRHWRHTNGVLGNLRAALRMPGKRRDILSVAHMEEKFYLKEGDSDKEKLCTYLGR